MLYDLNWLAEGQTFPPKSEWERLKTYEDNQALFKGDISEVLAPYRTRIQMIVDRFASYNGWSSESIDRFELELNYFQLMTLKTGDLIAGEPPTITENGGQDLDAGIKHTNMNGKLLTAVYDISRYGDSVARLKINRKKKKDFVVVSPSMWYPVISPEDKDEILFHVIAWIECLNPTAEQNEKRQFILKAQVHESGQYTLFTFAVKDSKLQTNKILVQTNSGLNVSLDSYTLGACLEKSKPIKTGFDDFAIIPFHNTVTSDTIFGLNDYDRITPLIAELQVRYSLESLILDKHSSPTICAPMKALTQSKAGEWFLPVGGVIPLEPNDEVPQYVTWDAAFTANHTMIEKLEKHLYSLSEMGAIVDDDSFGASQGFEALETRMTNARLKARRTSSGMTQSLKLLVSQLTGIDEEKISVTWNDGLPNNEYRETQIADMKYKTGLFDPETLLQDHFDKSPEDAEKITEKVLKRQANSMVRFDENDDENDDKLKDDDDGKG